MAKWLWLMAAAAVIVPVDGFGQVAQVPARTVGPTGGRWYNPAGYGPGYGYGYGGGYYGTTRAQGALTGMASVIGARGEAAYNYSEAAINAQEARSQYIDNEVKWQHAYYEVRDNYNKYYEATYHQPNKEKYQNFLANAKSGAPPKLTPTELDSSTGKVNWPRALLADDYAHDRTTIEDSMVVKAATSGGSGNDTKVVDATRSMQRTLKANISELPPQQYIEARKFLESLSYQTRYNVQ